MGTCSRPLWHGALAACSAPGASLSRRGHAASAERFVAHPHALLPQYGALPPATNRAPADMRERVADRATLLCHSPVGNAPRGGMGKPEIAHMTYWPCSGPVNSTQGQGVRSHNARDLRRPVREIVRDGADQPPTQRA